jgi:hypothetical protein
MKRILLTISVLALVVAACSDSDEQSTASPTTTVAPTTSTEAPSATTTPDSTPTNDAEADRATAEAAVLQSSDLPDYTASPESGREASDAAKQDFADCLGVENSFFDDTPGAQKVEGDNFERNGVQITSTASVHPTQATIDERFAQFSQPNVDECLADFFASEMKARLGGNVSVDVTPQTFDVGIGEQSLGVGLEITVTSDNQETTLYGEYLLASRDRAGLTVTVFSEAGAVDREMAIELLQTMYDRVGDRAA